MFNPIRIPTFTLNQGHPLARGLVGMWLATPGYNGFGSDKWLDISPYRNHGTLTNMDPKTDWTGDSPIYGGGSLDFDGSNDYVATPVAALTDWTVCVWANVQTSTATIQYTFGVQDVVTAGPGDSGIFVEFGAAGDAWGYYDNVSVVSGSNLDENRWYHLTVTKSGTEHAIYLNGVLENSGTRTERSISSPVFGNRGDKDWPFDGRIANVLIFDHGLSASSVAAIYRESLQGYPNLLRRIRVPVVNVAAGGGGLSIPIASYHYRHRIGA